MALLRTFLLDGSGASNSDCTPASDSNKILQEGAATDTADVTKAISGTSAGFPAFLFTFAWTSPPLNRWVWPDGTYTHSFRVSSVPTGTFGGRVRVRRVNSACTQVTAAADTAGGFNATGTYSWAPTFSNLPAGDYTDRYQVIIEATWFGASGNLTIDVDHADSFVSVPLFPKQFAPFVHENDVLLHYYPKGI